MLAGLKTRPTVRRRSMPTTTITAIELLKLAMRDRGGSFLSDAEYERCLLATAQPQATYPARRLAPGYWSIPITPLCLLAATFSEEPGASYELSCGGLGFDSAVTLKLTAGSDVRPSIDVTGCQVD